MVKEWSKIQNDACNSYGEGNSLSQVRKIMARDHNFEASERSFRKKFAEWGVKREDQERSRTALSSSSRKPESDAIANISGTFPSGIQQEEELAARAFDVADEGDNTVSSNARTRQVYYGGLVIELQEETEECNRLKQELEASRSVLPDIDTLKAKAEEADHRVTELEKLLKEAIEETSTAHDALEAGEARRECVEAAARDLDKKAGKLEQKRRMLRIG